MQRRRSWWWVVLVVLVVVVWRTWPAGAPASAARAEDPRLILGRPWIDREPKRPTDYVNAVFLADGAPVGLFQRASAYDIHVELFDYRRDAQHLDLMFLQTEKRHTLGYKITACDERPPFDLCLTLSKNPWGGPRRYYGLRDAGHEARLLPGLRQQLAARAAASAAAR